MTTPGESISDRRFAAVVPSRPNNLGGAGWILLSSLAFVLATMLVKVLGESLLIAAEK